ncbi:hypothetical protein KKF84_08570 [Myxococcota bacterium]|nr:hypothetical protein [Myxococcota bacterium]
MKYLIVGTLVVSLVACKSEKKSRVQSDTSPAVMDQKQPRPPETMGSAPPTAGMKKAMKITTKVVATPPVPKKVNAPAAKLPLPPAPPSDRLEALLKALKKANREKKSATAVMGKFVPEFKLSKGDEFPDSTEARVLEIRPGKALYGAFILFCARGVKVCGTDCEAAFSVKQAQGKNKELVTYKISPKIFAGTKHTFEFSPAFEDTRALLVRFTTPRKTECIFEDNSEYADKVERAQLFKVAKRRIVPYESFTTDLDSAEPGHHTSQTTTFKWLKGATEGTHYLGLERYSQETFSDTAPDSDSHRTTCQRTSSVILMPRGKYWKSIHGNTLNALRKKDPGLATLAKNMAGKNKRCSP